MSMADEREQRLTWDERFMTERLMKRCPKCSKSLQYNHLIYDLGYRKCLSCSAAIETYLPGAVNYLIIAVALSGLLTANPFWNAVSLACVMVWAFRRFRLRLPV
ncbi:MAG TPA: hypothetical protein VMN38_10730 [Sphingomicrobium sp.]|nr:hypothetical protein [Sphingomicrobium sp.]